MVQFCQRWLGWRPLDVTDLTFIPTLLFTLVFAGLTAYNLAWLLWVVLGREEWRLSHNCFEWWGCVLGVHWVRRYQDSKIWLRCTKHTSDEDSAGQSISTVNFEQPYLGIAKRDSKVWFQRVLHMDAEPEELLALSHLLARRLGWPVEVDPAFAEYRELSASDRGVKKHTS